MRTSVVVLVVVFIGCVYSVVHAHAVACNPRHRQSCGKAQLLGQTSTKLTQGYGPNVCQVTRRYSVQTFAYERSTTCGYWSRWGQSRCRTSCRKTNCTGPMEVFNRTKVECCRGFAVNPEDERSAKRHWWYGRRNNVLRTRGCLQELKATVTECLLDLNLTSFVGELLSSAPTLLGQLGNENTNDQFTVFAVRNEGFASGPISAQGHIVNKTVLGKQLLGGLVLKTQSAGNVFLHVGRAKDKDVCVNGIDIERKDACRAANGVVHIASSPLPQAMKTIAENLDDFSDFKRLLDAANITMLLNVTKKKSRTVLAPTNAAFNKLPANAIECLLRKENSRYLEHLVFIHIGAPAQFSCTLSQTTRFSTFTRYFLYVRVENGTILVTNRRIPLEQMDIAANNGVIHVIPEVIVPPRVDFSRICPTPSTTSPSATTPSATTPSATTPSATTPSPSTPVTPTTDAAGPAVGVVVEVN